MSSGDTERFARKPAADTDEGKRSGPGPLGDGLLAALAAREAIYRRDEAPQPLANNGGGTHSDDDPAVAASDSPGTTDVHDIAHLTERIADLEHERDLAEARADDLEQAAAERDRFEAEARDLAARFARLQEELAHQVESCDGCAQRERRIAALEDELRELYDAMEKGDSAPSGEEIVELKRRYSTLLEESEADRRRHAEEIAGLNQRIDEARQLVEQARAEARPNVPDRSAELARLETKYKTLLTENEKDRRMHAKEIASLSEHLTQARTQIERWRNEAEKLRSAFTAGGGSLPSADLGARPPTSSAAAPPVASANQRDHVDLDGESTPQAPRRPAFAPQAAAEPAHVSGAEIVLLDDSDIGQDTLQRITRFNLAISKLPEGSSPEIFAGGTDVVYVAANLALPSTWAALRRIRAQERSRNLPIIAYALAPRSDLGFWFGRSEFSLYPSCALDLLEMLRKIGSGSKQVVAIGSDNELLENVGRFLSRDRTRSSVARDRRQALDVVMRVYPQAALVHAGQNPVDAFRALASIREMAAFRELPTIFLLDDEPKEKEEDKLGGGMRTILRLGSLEPEKLAELLPSVLNQLKSANRQGRR